jgi:hypothetical protein
LVKKIEGILGVNLDKFWTIDMVELNLIRTLSIGMILDAFSTHSSYASPLAFYTYTFY